MSEKTQEGRKIREHRAFGIFIVFTPVHINNHRYPVYF
jgi:hypothetical protein